jgi:hypothetical protein
MAKLWYLLKENPFRIIGALLLTALVTPTIFSLSDDTYHMIFRFVPRSFATSFTIFLFLVLSVLTLILGWLISGSIPYVAASLGFSKGPQYEVTVSGEGNIVTIPSTDGGRSKAHDAFLMILSEKYNTDNPLSALDNARSRILDHISKLRNNSVTNLFIGIGIAIVGVAILFSAIFQIDSFVDASKKTFDIAGYLTFALLPKLSVTLFVQIFSYFFLVMYRSNQTDIRYFQNEITNIDITAGAIILYLKNKTAANSKVILTHLSKVERNRVLRKNERSISDPDDTDFVRALAMISRIQDMRDHKSDLPRHSSRRTSR